MQKVPEDQYSFRSRVPNQLADIRQITIEYRTRHGNAGRLKDLGLAPVRIGQYQRFFRVPVDRFASVEGERLVSYFC